MSDRTGVCAFCQKQFTAVGQRGAVPKLCPEHDTYRNRNWVKRHPGTPHPSVKPRTCGRCGTPIDHRNGKARWCSRSCATLGPRAERREHYNAKAREYQQTLHGREYRSRYQRENRERRQEWARASRRRNPERYRGYWRSWAEANPELVRLCHMLRQERIKNNPQNAEVTPRDVRRLINRYSGCCAYCGVKAESLHLDHVIPVARGGRTAIGNLLPACERCNLTKHSKLLATWRYRTKVGAK